MAKNSDATWGEISLGCLVSLGLYVFCVGAVIAIPVAVVVAILKLMEVF